MKLGNPPVIEAWVEFRFATGEGGPPWDEALAVMFLEQALGGRYRIEHFIGGPEVVLDNTGGRPSIKDAKISLHRVRAIRTDSNDRYLQVGRGLLVCNLVRKQQAWPTFDVLCNEALEILPNYLDFFKPKKLLAAAVNYRDIVSIPWPDSKQVDLREFIKLYPEVPAEVFGRVGDFRISCSLEETAQNGVLTLSIQKECQPDKPNPDGSAPSLRLRMDWNVTSSNLESTETDAVRTWLMGAHDDLFRMFQSAFTDKGWSLFDPQEETPQ